MIIGNMYFRIERSKRYEPEELADLILQEPYGQMYANNLMRNNEYGWGYITYPCMPEERDGKIFLRIDRPTHFEANDASRASDDFISSVPIGDATPEFKQEMRKRAKRGIDASIIMFEHQFFLVVHEDAPTEKARMLSQTRDLLTLFFEDTGINDTKTLRKAAQVAGDMYRRDIGMLSGDPFVLPSRH